MRKLFKIETDDDVVTLHETDAELPVFEVGDRLFLPDSLREYLVCCRYWSLKMDGTCELIYALS